MLAEIENEGLRDNDLELKT